MSFYGGLTGGINQTSRTLTSILTVSDGFTTMSGGQIIGTQYIETENITINNNLTVPELTTGNIQCINNNLVIGDITDSITIYGNEIKLVGNVVGYESANVYIVDNRIELNAGGGNILLPNSGISVLGDGNLVVSSLLTDINGDWIFSSPNNIVTVGTLNASNVNIDNISFDNLSSANIEATNKFITPNLAILDRTVSRTSAISHLNTNTLKSQNLISTIINNTTLNTSNVNTSNVNTSNVNTNNISFLNQLPLRIEHGVTATVNTDITITFDVPFNNPPTVLVSGFRNSAVPPIAYIRGLSTTSVNLYAKNDGGGDYGDLRFSWVAIGI
jgi:hypothetical protein